MLRELISPPESREPEVVDLEPGPLRVPGRFLIVLIFGGLVLWWVLGVSAFIQDALVIPLFLIMLARGRISTPKIFFWWLLFMLWVLLSGTQVGDVETLASYGIRTSLYVAATILFLYVYSTPRKALPSRFVVKVLTAFWIMTTLGGIAGMFAPTLDFTTPFEAILPQETKNVRFVHDLVHASSTAPQAFLGTNIRRPRAPFWSTNHWGAFFAMTLPFAIGTLITSRSRLWRLLLGGLVVISIFPLVFSFNRGAWFAAAVSMMLALGRLALGRRRSTAKYARAMILIGIVAGALFLVTPLFNLVLYRAVGGGFVNTRESYIIGAVSAARVSPILGFGTPIDATDIGLQPRRVSLGSNGQFWTVLVSQGYPGLLFFVTFFLLLVLKTWKIPPASGGRDPTSRFWAHISILAGVLVMPFYELIPWGMLLLLVAAAIALREGKPAYITLPPNPDPGERLPWPGRTVGGPPPPFPPRRTGRNGWQMSP